MAATVLAPLAALGPLVLLALLALAGCESTIEPVGRRLDRTAPRVLQTVPAAAATEVDTRATIVVTFSEPMDAATLVARAFRVSVLGQPRAGLIAGDGTRFVFVPEDTLPGNREVAVEIRDVADGAGNRLPDAYRFTFWTTGTNPLPPRTPASPTPADEAGGVAIDPILAWEGGSDSGDPVSYDVWLGTSAENLSERASGLTERSFRPGPLPYATRHFWRVIARSLGGETAGPLWSFTTENNPDPGNQPPPAPCSPDPADGSLTVPASTSLGWGCLADPNGDPVTFEIYLGTSPDPPLAATVPAPPHTPPSPLLANTLYRWRVVADDGRGGRTSSPTWIFRTETPPPPNDPPSAPAAPITPSDGSTIAGNDVDLTWSGGVDPEGDPVTFDVRLGTDNPPPYLTTVAARALRSEGLAYSTRHYWQIVAADDHGHAVAGPVWEFVTPGPPPPPNRAPTAPCDPAPPDGATDVPVNATLRWSCGDDPDGDPVEYVVFLARSDATPDSVAVVTGKSYSALLQAGIYFWRIEARDGRGGVTSSPGVWVFTTNQPPSAPCNPTPEDGAQNVLINVHLRWECGVDPEGDTVKYFVFFGSAPDPALIDSTSARNYRVGGVDLGATYYWKILARDNRGAGSEGPVWSFLTVGLGP